MAISTLPPRTTEKALKSPRPVKVTSFSYLVSGVSLQSVGLQLVVGLQAQPVRGFLLVGLDVVFIVISAAVAQELGRQVRREVVLPIRLHRGQITAISTKHSVT